MRSVVPCLCLVACLASPARADEKHQPCDPPVLTQLGLHFADDFLGAYYPAIDYHDSSRLEVLWRPSEPRTIGHRERFPGGDRNLDTGSPMLVPRFLYSRTGGGILFDNGIAVGREAYYPRDFEEGPIDPDDRPFAGWLYLGLMTRITHPEMLWQDACEVDLGIMGPSALGELLDPDEAERENQVPDEVALMISWDRRWMVGYSLWEEEFGGYISPRVGVRAGSPFTDVSAGLTVLIGWHTPRDFRPGMLTTAPPPELTSRKDHEGGRIVPEYRSTYSEGSFYAFGGVEGRAVAYNAFLDGTLFRDSPDADRNGFVLDAHWGIGLHVGGTYYSLVQGVRSSELRHDASTRSFGSVQFTATVPF